LVALAVVATEADIDCEDIELGMDLWKSLWMDHATIVMMVCL